MSRFSLHKRQVEIPIQGNRRFDEVNGVRLFFYTRRLVGLTNGQLVHAAA